MRLVVASPKSETTTPTLRAPCAATNCGIPEKTPTTPEPSGNETLLSPSRAVLIRDPTTGIPAASSTGQTRSLLTTAIPTTATTPWSTALCAQPSVCAASNLVSQTITLTLWRTPVLSLIPPLSLTFLNRAFTAPGHSRLFLKSPIVMTLTGAPLDVWTDAAAPPLANTEAASTTA